MPHIAIIGAGITGIITACSIIEKVHDAHVTVLSDKFSPNTTSDLSNGLWYPFCFDMNDCSSKDLVLKWSKLTYQKFMNTCTSSEANETGGQVIACFVLSKTAESLEPIWKDFVVQYSTLNENEEKLLNFSDDIKSGFQFLTVNFDMKVYMHYLMNNLKKKGVRFQEKLFKNLSNINVVDPLDKQDFDYIVNCTGLGARELINDKNVFTISDDIVKMHAPWLKYAVVVDDHEEKCFQYIVPQIDYVLTGAVRQQKTMAQDDNMETSDEFRNLINNTVSLLPNLKNAKSFEQYTCAWSFRDGGVRLEMEVIQDANGLPLKVFHNYGHGGSGISLCWGTGYEVAEMMQKDWETHKSGFYRKFKEAISHSLNAEFTHK